MSENVLELYQQTVRPLPEKERLTLAVLILQEISQATQTIQPDRKGDIRKYFGFWKGGDENGADNEQIDRDLALSYEKECEED